MSPHVLNEFHHLPLWIARLWQDQDTRFALLEDPVAFVNWYSLANMYTADWPAEVVAIADDVSSRSLTFNDASQALRQTSLFVGADADLGYAKSLLEGYEVWRWTRTSPGALFPSDKLLRFVEQFTQAQARRRLKARTGVLARALTFDALSEQILSAGLALSAVREFEHLLNALRKTAPHLRRTLWPRLFGCKSEQLAAAVSPESPLIASRILSVSADGLPVLSTTWLDLLMGDSPQLLTELVEPLKTEAGYGVPARLAPEDVDLAQRLLRAKGSKGVNLLLYGAETLERGEQLNELLRASGRRGFALKVSARTSPRDLPSLAFAAVHLLQQSFPEDSALVIEAPADVLARRAFAPSLAHLFGFDEPTEGPAPFEALMLGSNSIPVVWAGAGASTLAEDAMARFVFHAPLRKATKSERAESLRRTFEALGLSESTREKLLGWQDVSALQLQTAVQAAKLAGARTKAKREQYLLQAVQRSLRAMGRETEAAVKECVTEYSLEFLNYGGRFGPEQILQAFKVRPKGSLCLYGPPGTGKTQFAEHLAQQLGRPLMARRASDLLSKWVGENEKNLAKMFSEAKDNEAILFLDEGDSFLRDRNRAGAQWEVTQVNELLQQMERFNGIFILATNLFEGLDLAALRRFTFKMELRELTAEQRLTMFLRETGLEAAPDPLSDAEKETYLDSLVLMGRLTSGDFATVKRQSILLGKELSPAEWLEQLRMECALKSGLAGSQERVARS